MNFSFTPPAQIQNRLIKLAGLFLFFYSTALTLSPAARARTWNTELRWSHWLGLLIWAVAVFVIQNRMAKFTPDADPILFPACALLAGWGLLTIWRLDAGFGLRQAAWLAICCVSLLIGIQTPNILTILYRFKYVFLISGLLLTGLTLVFGTNPGGSGPRLWLGCCGIYLQPSEPLKLLLVVYLAAFLADRIPIQSRLLPLLLPSLLLTGLALAILLTQRDLGTASIFIFLYAAMVYMASGKRRILLISLTLLIIAAVVGYYFIDIIRYRLTAWMDPWTDPSGRSYQVIQSILAVSNGGLFGRGPGMGSPGLVPVSHSDFIFTSIAEESGVLGSFALLALLSLISMRGFLITIRASSNFRRLLAAGITMYFSAQSILIIGGNLRLLPLTGVTLPFVSYGGSSLLTSFIGLLFLVQISNGSEEEPAGLQQPMPYLHMVGLIGAGILACSLINGWWAIIRVDDLLTRTDNPRRTISDRFVMRGALFDRQNRAINVTTGEPGGYNRRYLIPALSPITGYTHPVYGQAGLEASLDPYLRGLQGNPALLIWWDHVLYGQPPTGLNVRLSLDLDIQQQADDLLGQNTGSLVLINAQTGEILAMVSHPYFDANQMDTIGEALPEFPDAPLINRTTQALFMVGSAVKPFLDAAFNVSSPDSLELTNFYEGMGFYRTPLLSLPAAPAQARGTAELAISPVQMVAAVAAISNAGLCPGLQIANAVQTPTQGWVALTDVEKTSTCLPLEGIKRVSASLQETGKPYWDYVGTSSQNNQRFTWFLGGTLPNWSGTPLAVVVILEKTSPSLAKSIGQTLLQKTIQP